MNEKKQESSKPMQGWECSKCGSVYAPYVRECDMCKGSNVQYTYSSDTYTKRD